MSVPKVLHVVLGIGATNDDLIDQMRIMKRAREEKFYSNVTCSIEGFVDDPRELFEIPEVRGFCARLVCQGFISYLDPSTTMPLEQDEMIAGSWGAFEVWFCSIGRMKQKASIYRKDWDRFESALGESNQKADSLVGPMA